MKNKNHKFFLPFLRRVSSWCVTKTFYFQLSFFILSKPRTISNLQPKTTPNAISDLTGYRFRSQAQEKQE